MNVAFQIPGEMIFSKVSDAGIAICQIYFKPKRKMNANEYGTESSPWAGLKAATTALIWRGGLAVRWSTVSEPEGAGLQPRH